VLQKYVDQAISVNTSYNPKFYPDEKIPMSELLNHLLMFYKLGGKTLYYCNTNDQAGEINVDQMLSLDQEVKSSPCLACVI
jgi:ribonucleoside-diphosphate reductase alpha chain